MYGGQFVSVLTWETNSELFERVSYALTFMTMANAAHSTAFVRFWT